MRFLLILVLFFIKPVTAEERIVGDWRAAQIADSELLLIRLGWGAANILAPTLKEHPLGLCREEFNERRVPPSDETICYLGIEKMEFVSNERIQEHLNNTEETLEWALWGYISASSPDSEQEDLKRVYLRGKIAQKLKQVLFQQGLQPEDPVEFETEEIFCGKKRFRLRSRSGVRVYAPKLDYCRFDIVEDEILPTPKNAR